MNAFRYRLIAGLSFCAFSSGCFLFDQTDRSSIRTLKEQLSAPVAPNSDRVIIDYRLIDQPAGDPFAVDQLWNMVRCPLSHEKAALLAENGIRVGIISGVVPPEFISRVTSERHLVDPRALATRAGEEKIVPVNGPLDQAGVKIVREWTSEAEELQASGVECGFAIVATPSDRGQIQFRCNPSLQFGSKQSWLRPTADRTQFVWENAKTQDMFQSLIWNVNLGANDYLVIGPTEQANGTLGELFFFASEPTRIRQRFLVLRGRAESGPAKASESVASKAIK